MEHKYRRNEKGREKAISHISFGCKISGCVACASKILVTIVTLFHDKSTGIHTANAN